MSGTTSELVGHLLKSNLIDVGEVRLTKTSLGKQGGPRYLIYLPLARNYLWRRLHELNVKVRVYIELPEGVEDIMKAKTEATATR
jgi:hypothetical protein